MATTNNDAVQKLYVAYFNRPADPAGLAFWAGNVGANGDTSAIAAEFAKSAEYTSTFNGMTNAQAVAAVYQNLFGRAADANGAAFWTAALDANTITIDNVVTSIAAGAQGTDSTIVSNKVAAASAFTAAIDTQAEISGYAGVSANAAAKAWLSKVTDSNSLTTALDPATLATTVANVVAAGTPFSLAGALANLDASNTAVTKFVATIDTDGDGLTSDTQIGDIATAKTDAITTVATDLDAAQGNVYTLFTTTTSDTVREALISAQQATYAANLTSAQALVTADNAAIANVTGLSNAVTTLTAANTALTAAQTAQTSAQATLAADQASFAITMGAKGTYATTPADANGNTSLTLTTGTGATQKTVTLATITAAGKATLGDNVTASDYAGLSELIAAYNADANADANVTKASANVDNAQLGVNLLDVATTGTIDVGGTNYSETALIGLIRDQINATNPTGTAGYIAGSATPTASQIAAEMAVLHAQTDQTAYNSFKALVDAETAATTFNPLVTKLNSDTSSVTSINDTISALAKDVAAMHVAVGNANALTGLQATVTANTKILTDKGYSVVDLDTAHVGTPQAPTTVFAGAASDVFLVDGHDATIAAFGLQGTDSLFVGTGYTMVQGAIGGKGVTPSDAALEIFVSSNANGDAQLQIETHAYSSSVTGTNTGEVVTITLTGVDASTLHLGTDGIITTGTAATTA